LWAPNGLNDVTLRTGVRGGQSSLAKKIFEHAVSTGRVSYSFSNLVSRSTCDVVPLNVINDITSSPPLSGLKMEASSVCSSNACCTVYSDLDSLDNILTARLGKRMILEFADDVTTAGKTHLVCLGPNPMSDLDIPVTELKGSKRLPGTCFLRMV
jgi:hypothetical protein